MRRRALFQTASPQTRPILAPRFLSAVRSERSAVVSPKKSSLVETVMPFCLQRRWAPHCHLPRSYCQFTRRSSSARFAPVKAHKMHFHVYLTRCTLMSLLLRRREALKTLVSLSWSRSLTCARRSERSLSRSTRHSHKGAMQWCLPGRIKEEPMSMVTGSLRPFQSVVTASGVNPDGGAISAVFRWSAQVSSQFPIPRYCRVRVGICTICVALLFFLVGPVLAFGGLLVVSDGWCCQRLSSGCPFGFVSSPHLRLFQHGDTRLIPR